MLNVDDSSCEPRASVVSICCHFLIRVASLAGVSEPLFFWTSLRGVSLSYAGSFLERFPSLWGPRQRCDSVLWMLVK